MCCLFFPNTGKCTQDKGTANTLDCDAAAAAAAVVVIPNIKTNQFLPLPPPRMAYFSSENTRYALFSL